MCGVKFLEEAQPFYVLTVNLCGQTCSSLSGHKNIYLDQSILALFTSTIPRIELQTSLPLLSSLSVRGPNSMGQIWELVQAWNMPIHRIKHTGRARICSYGCDLSVGRTHLQREGLIGVATTIWRLETLGIFAGTNVPGFISLLFSR